jgi:2-phospho-L-lactate guanylyltransferase
MALWAIVPVKPLRRGKSRLAAVMSADDRAELNQFLLEHTIQVLNQVEDIESILVVSRDPAALAIARDLGARTVLENGSPDLNLALTRATEVAKSYETRGVLVIPADLPRLGVEDVNKMLAYREQAPVVVVAPDREKKGTNALFISPLGLIRYDYGEGSFAKHCQQAQRVGAQLEICNLPSLALDLDEPDDLNLMKTDIRVE